MSKQKIYGPPKTDWGPAPPGYIPGIGRGAKGFTTRADIGPAKKAGDEIIPERGQGPAELQRIKEAMEREKEENLSAAMYDEFNGYGGSLFAGKNYDKEDEAVDRIYQAFDERMASRHAKHRREKVTQQTTETEKRPTTELEFKDLKNDLKEVSYHEWEAIPDAMDLSGRNKLLNQARQSTYTSAISVSDSLLTASRAGLGQSVSSIDPNAAVDVANGHATPFGVGGRSDLMELSKARDQALSIKLNKVADSGTKTEALDQKGYLTDLGAMSSQPTAQISDIKQMRKWFKSIITSNPQNAAGWIGAARLERDLGKMSVARELIAKGCEACPTSEDIWLEAADLNPKDARAVLAQAVTKLPQSVAIWLLAAQQETTLDGKRAVLRRALEVIPRSVQLWKCAVDLEQPQEAKVLLSRAVELIPKSVELWLALAQLETYERARAVLNKARQALPTEPKIWVTAARLEEANGNTQNLANLMRNAVTSLTAHKAVITRDTWMEMAVNAEKAGFAGTCHAIIMVTLGIGIDDLDKRNTWTNDIDRLLLERHVETARAASELLLSTYPHDEALWLKRVKIEREYGNRDKLLAVLERATKDCPKSETLWLMCANCHWVAGDVKSARSVVAAAFEANPDSEKVWLEAVRIEFESEEYERAVFLLNQARARANTARVWLKSAKMARVLGLYDDEYTLLEEAKKRFPQSGKIWIMLAQYYQRTGNQSSARRTYIDAVRTCPNYPDLWLCYAKFEMGSGSVAELSKARAVLETARAAIPKHPDLWVAACRVEHMAKNPTAAQQLLSQALKEIPQGNCGALWAYAIETASKQQRKATAHQVLLKDPKDARVYVAVAKMFWDDRKVAKAREWLNRAIAVNSDYGDAWAYLYKLELEEGDEASQATVEKRCVNADPKHGELWCAVSKQDRKIVPKVGEVLKQVAKGIQSIFKPI